MENAWSVALEDDLLAGNVPVCLSMWSDPALDPLWSVPSLLDGPGLDHQLLDPLVLDQPLSIMPVNTEPNEQDIQTEEWAEEKGTNTDEDWDTVMSSIDEYSASLKLQYESLVKTLNNDQNEHLLHIESLKKKRDEKKQQYKILIDKITSLQEKLNLNSSKTTRKNFSIKLEELKAEKVRLLEGNRRLVAELEEVDKKLKLLTEEQNSDKVTWEREIADLRTEKGRISKQVEEASQIALKDEMAVLESQRDLAISRVEDWIAEAERYLGTLRLSPSPQCAMQRMEWEKNVPMVRSNLSRLQTMYNENLKLLQLGRHLDSLPTIPLPNLPHVPMIDLFISPLRNSMAFYNGPLIHPPPLGLLPHPLGEFHLTGVPPRVAPPLSAALSQSLPAPPVSTLPHAAGAKPQLTMPTTLPPQPSFRMPSMPSMPAMPPVPSMPTVSLPLPTPNTVPPSGPYGAAVPAHVSTATTHVPVPTATTSAAAVRPQVTLPVVSARNSSPQTVSSNPPPTGKLDKLLERLGAQFPQCTRTQLMGVLQQIKSERGTMAGMSMDEVTQQVSQRLAQNDRPAPGPIAPPSGSRVFAASHGPIQRPSMQPLAVRPPVRASNVPVYQPRPSQAPPVRRLCLMCQNHVEPGTQYITNCPHTLHKECISTWLKSSKDHSCPFCPSK